MENGNEIENENWESIIAIRDGDEEKMLKKEETES